MMPCTSYLRLISWCWGVQVEGAADRMCTALSSAGPPSSSPGLFYADFNAALPNGVAAGGAAGAAALPAPAMSEQVADMAAGWCQLLASGPGSGSTAGFGLAGAAASVLVAACSRCARSHIAARLCKV